MFINRIAEHRVVVSHRLKEYFPHDIAKVISSYTYCLQGISDILGFHESSVLSITTLPDGRIVTGSGAFDGTIKIWNPMIKTLNTQEHILKGHTSHVWFLASLPGGRIVSGSSDKSIRIWNTDNISYYCDHTIQDSTDEIYCLAVISDKKLIIGSSSVLKVWNTTDNKFFHEDIFDDNDEIIYSIAIHPDKSIIIGSGNAHESRLKILDPVSGKIKYTLYSHSDMISCISILNDKRIVTGSWDTTLKIWNLDTKTCEITLTDHTDKVKCVAVLPDGRIVSGSNDCTLKIWDPVMGVCNATYICHTGPVECVYVLPDGRIVSGSWDKSVRIWS